MAVLQRRVGFKERLLFLASKLKITFWFLRRMKGTTALWVTVPCLLVRVCFHLAGL